MAVDTASKRFSLLGFGGPVPQMVLVPSGSIALADRADLLFLYAGIALDNPVAPSGQLLSLRHVRNFNRDLSGGMR